MWINVKWAISHPCRSLIFEAHIHAVSLFGLHFCQFMWQTFILGNLILLKWHKITKIVGGIEIKSAIPFQFQSIPSCNSNSNSGIGIGIAINANSNSRIYPNPDVYIYIYISEIKVVFNRKDIFRCSHQKLWPGMGPLFDDSLCFSTLDCWL